MKSISVEFDAMQARRKYLLEGIKAYEKGERLLTATANQIAAIKIEIADLEMRIIVAGGTLPRCD